MHAQRTGIIVSPQRANLILTTDIPDIEFDVLVGDALDVEPDSGNSGDVLVKLQFIQNSFEHTSSSADGRGLWSPIGIALTSLSCCIETEHENAHLL